MMMMMNDDQKSFFNFAETWPTCRPEWTKFRNFGQNRKSGKFSDLSENFPLRRMFQFMWFWKKNFFFLGSGKFSTSAECSNSCDFGIKKICLEVGYESLNARTYLYIPNFKATRQRGHDDDDDDDQKSFFNFAETWPTCRPEWTKFRNFGQNRKSGKFSDLSENFPLRRMFQFMWFWKKNFFFLGSGKFSTSAECSNSCDFGIKKICLEVGYESLNARTYLYIPNFKATRQRGRTGRYYTVHLQS